VFEIQIKSKKHLDW